MSSQLEKILEQKHANSITASNAPVVKGSFAHEINQAMVSVVNIYTSKIIVERANHLEQWILQNLLGDTIPKYRKHLQRSLGSGVIMTPDGYVITNHHVIDGSAEIQIVTSEETVYPARVIGSDPKTDLAILKIEGDTFTSIEIAKPDSVRVGDLAFAIGNPFGVGQTVTMGIVSATRRDNKDLNISSNFIQTDAAINPGNSGGALVDANGRLIGINTAIYSKSGGSMGIGFAIPASTVEQVASDLIKFGNVTRIWLGVTVQYLTPELAQAIGITTSAGILISGVTENGPAFLAGLEPGDVIVSIDGKSVVNAKSFESIISQLRPGDTIEILGVRRNRKFSAVLQVEQLH